MGRSQRWGWNESHIMMNCCYHVKVISIFLLGDWERSSCKHMGKSSYYNLHRIHLFPLCEPVNSLTAVIPTAFVSTTWCRTWDSVLICKTSSSPIPLRVFLLSLCFVQSLEVSHRCSPTHIALVPSLAPWPFWGSFSEVMLSMVQS